MTPTLMSLTGQISAHGRANVVDLDAARGWTGPELATRTRLGLEICAARAAWETERIWHRRFGKAQNSTRWRHPGRQHAAV